MNFAETKLTQGHRNPRKGNKNIILSKRETNIQNTDQREKKRGGSPKREWEAWRNLHGYRESRRKKEASEQAALSLVCFFFFGFCEEDLREESAHRRAWKVRELSRRFSSMRRSQSLHCCSSSAAVAVSVSSAAASSMFEWLEQKELIEKNEQKMKDRYIY